MFSQDRHVVTFWIVHYRRPQSWALPLPAPPLQSRHSWHSTAGQTNLQGLSTACYEYLESLPENIPPGLALTGGGIPK